MKRLLALSLTLLLLSACSASSPAPPETEPVAGRTESAAQTEYPKQTEAADGNALPNPVTPFIHLTADMDGDGQDDKLSVCRKWLIVENESGEESSYSHYFRCSVTMEIGGETAIWEHEYDTPDVKAFILKTLDGRNALVLSIDTGGQGGPGFRHVYALVYDGGIAELPIPNEAEQGLSGFMTEARYIDGFQFEVHVPTTGFTGRAALEADEIPYYINRGENNREEIYDEEGKLLTDSTGISGCCTSSATLDIASDGREGIRLEQYFYGVMHYMGPLLVSVINWDADSCVVLEQKIQ